MKTKNIKTKVANMANSAKQHIKDHAVEYIMAGVAIVPTLVCLKLKKENDKLIERGERRENTAYMVGLRDGYNDMHKAYRSSDPDDKLFLDDILENGCSRLKYVGGDGFTKRVERAKNGEKWVQPMMWVYTNTPTKDEE